MLSWQSILRIGCQTERLAQLRAFAIIGVILLQRRSRITMPPCEYFTLFYIQCGVYTEFGIEPTFVPRALPSASWLWWYISPVAACFFVQPGAGCQGCIAPPFYGGLPLTVCPGCAISPASDGGISSRAAPFPMIGKGRGDWVELSY